MADCALETLDQSHRQMVLPMIAEAFSRDDPLAASQGISESEFHDFIDGLYEGFIQDRLSQAAIDIDTNRAAAVVFAEAHRCGPGVEGTDAIASLMDTAHESYYTDYQPARGELMHIHFIASNPDYRGRQLVQKLIANCLRAARDQGFRRAVVEASGIRSRNLLEKHFHFQPRVTVGYADFEWKGSKPFNSIAEHGGLALMDLEL
jgi:ribosomal protein S18 acetylase RimI-like enzyme